MSWVKLDDQILTHPKILRAGRDARDLFIAGLCFCASQLTDGAIPAGALRILGGMADIEDAPASASRLVTVGLWTQEEDGSYLVHDLQLGRWSIGDSDELRQGWDAVAARLRPVVFERDGYTCQYCGARDDLTVDHIFPLARGGGNEIENLTTACRSCNSAKGARTPEEWQR